MFSTAKTELRELVRLVAETERYDATLAAKPHMPTEASRDERHRKEQRKMQLLEKYELI